MYVVNNVFMGLVLLKVIRLLLPNGFLSLIFLKPFNSLPIFV